MALTANAINKKIIFNDDGTAVTAGTGSALKKKSKGKKFNDKKIKSEDFTVKDEVEDNEEEDYFAKREKMHLKQKAVKETSNSMSQKKWYNVYPQYPASEEVLDQKEHEQMELYNLCKNSFDAEKSNLNKHNPSDTRWLNTALHRGTAKDRANAGALLVTSNPLANLEALSTLISFTKPSNKSSTEVIGILTDLWKQVLLPPHRKLWSLQLRGADWKLVRKDTELSKEQQRHIYTYWYFENELKDHYFEFLKNLQLGMQTGQENNKSATIVSASQLLAYAPEKEQMLLTMLINKLGDPVPKIASKALHHLTELAHKHPNMSVVIVTEAEKLLFRNNLSERAQHFALCFLASVASGGHAAVCSKLVHICFALFKVLVQKGAVNSRTMQAILRCLQHAVVEAQPAKTTDGGEILNKDMQDTIYRLVHIADIRISVQTLGLLLQLVSAQGQKSQRFYQALYKKLLDPELYNVGGKTAAQLLHIVHRAVHIDDDIPRAQAFIKRLLQLALYTPAQMAAGCLIVIYKLLRTRKELTSSEKPSVDNLPSVDDEALARFDSDDEEEKYKDVPIEEDIDNGTKSKEPEADISNDALTASSTSWHHVKVAQQQEIDEGALKARPMSACKYDPYHRVPSYAGAELALRNELLLLRTHFHPTVQVFADNILNKKPIHYYGDPLKDFGMSRFLERFAFKNPKKLDQQTAETPTLAHKQYVPHGARGKPVNSLTKANCTEDELYIFNFLEQKRKRAIANEDKSKPTKGAEDAESEADADLKPGEVNDDEFDEYLSNFFGKKAKAAAAAENGLDEEENLDEIDFLEELSGELKTNSKKQKNEKKKQKLSADDDDDDLNEIDADWGDENPAEFEEDGSEQSDDEGSIDLDDNEGEDDDDDDDRSISLNEDSDNDEDSHDDSDEDDVEQSNTSEDETINSKVEKSKKTKKIARKQLTNLNEKSFTRKLKHSTDMSSLFAAADDFADLLEETGKTKGQGTVNAVFNKDKSSDKQMNWEEKRHSKNSSKKRYNKSDASSFPTKRRKY